MVIERLRGQERREGRPGPRSFDPLRMADLEYKAWVSYYQRQWFSVLAASVGLKAPYDPAGSRARPRSGGTVPG